MQPTYPPVTRGDPAPPAPVEFDALLERMLGSTSLVRQAVDLMAAQCAADVARLESAAAGGDAPGMAGAAHSLKGAAAYFAADAVHAAAARLEALGRAGELAAARACLDLLRGEVDRLVRYLPQIRVLADSAE